MGSADNTQNTQNTDSTVTAGRADAPSGMHADARSTPVIGSPASFVQPRLVAAIVGGIVVADQITKLVAVDFLGAPYLPHDVLGNTLRWTLVYNPGAAFGLHLGEYSRWIFTALTFGAIALLWRLYRDTRPGEQWRVLAIALVAGGAAGNLIDRLRSARGVVDFIDVGIGTSRWPTFNVADMAVSCGAILLAAVLWREDATRQAAERARATESSPVDAPLHG